MGTIMPGLPTHAAAGVCTTATSPVTGPRGGGVEARRAGYIRGVGVSEAHHHRDIAVWHATCRSSALSFQAVPFEKGVTRAVIWRKKKKETNKEEGKPITPRLPHNAYRH